MRILVNFLASHRSAFGSFPTGLRTPEGLFQRHAVAKFKVRPVSFPGQQIYEKDELDSLDELLNSSACVLKTRKNDVANEPATSPTAVFPSQHPVSKPRVPAFRLVASNDDSEESSSGDEG